MYPRERPRHAARLKRRIMHLEFWKLEKESYAILSASQALGGP